LSQNRQCPSNAQRKRWEFPKSEAKTPDINNLVFLACILAQSHRRESFELSSPRKRQIRPLFVEKKCPFSFWAVGGRPRQRGNFHRTQVLPPTEMAFPNSPPTRHSMRMHPLCSWRQWFSPPFPLTGAGMRARRHSVDQPHVEVRLAGLSAGQPRQRENFHRTQVL